MDEYAISPQCSIHYVVSKFWLFNHCVPFSIVQLVFKSFQPIWNFFPYLFICCVTLTPQLLNHYMSKFPFQYFIHELFHPLCNLLFFPNSSCIMENSIVQHFLPILYLSSIFSFILQLLKPSFPTILHCATFQKF
jgi:hypothetical protein